MVKRLKMLCFCLMIIINLCACTGDNHKQTELENYNEALSIENKDIINENNYLNEKINELEDKLSKENDKVVKSTDKITRLETQLQEKNQLLEEKNSKIELSKNSTYVIVNDNVIAHIDVTTGEYNMYGLNGIDLNKEGINEFIKCYIDNEVDTRNVLNDQGLEGIQIKKLYKDYIALTGEWDANIRKVYRDCSCSDEQLMAVRDILDNKKLSNTPIIIKESYRTDIDGNGVDDFIIRANNDYKVDLKSQSDSKIFMSNEYLKYTNEIGYYDIIIALVNGKVSVLYEQYRYINNGEYCFNFSNLNEEVTNHLFENWKKELSDLTKEEVIDKCTYLGNPVYLESEYDTILPFAMYTELIDYWYSEMSFINCLDIDKDNNLELIFEFPVLYGGYIIYDFVENNFIKYEAKYIFGS